eukprot:403353770
MAEPKEISIQLKDIGNQCYNQQNYDQAIDYYTKAIEINENNPTFFMNRARCYKMKKLFDKQYQDSLKSIELDDTYIKAYIVNGEALVELGKNENNTAKIEKGIQRMKKALNMCYKQNQRGFEKEIQNQLKKAEKIKWYKESELTEKERDNLMDQLRYRVDNIRDSDLINRFETYLNSADPTTSSTLPQPGTRQEEKKEAPKRKIKEIPDYLLCRITDDLMENPVIIQSGFTYEKSAILEHFQKNGAYDPITRQQVDQNILIPNNYIKQAAQHYLERNPWAFQYIPGEKYHHYHM